MVVMVGGAIVRVLVAMTVIMMWVVVKATYLCLSKFVQEARSP
jgi:hypothetical protein